MSNLILAATTASQNSFGGAALIGGLVALLLIIFLVIKLFGLILRHPFITILIFLFSGFAVFKFALAGIIGIGALAAVAVGSLIFNWN